MILQQAATAHIVDRPIQVFLRPYPDNPLHQPAACRTSSNATDHAVSIAPVTIAPAASAAPAKDKENDE